MSIFIYRCLLVLCLLKITTTLSLASAEVMSSPLLDLKIVKESLKRKRPFCNAFTGCGKKRSMFATVTPDEENNVSYYPSTEEYFSILLLRVYN